MSLLLEALKKAELAKQQGIAGQPAVSGEAGPMELAPLNAAEPQAATPEKPLITRDRLPDITQPLEILSEDLPSVAAPRREKAPGSASPEPVSPSPVRPSAAAERAERQAAVADQDRTSARQLFEAKASDYDPRRPFYYVLGGIGVIALGVVGYFAYQLFAPRPSFYTGPAGGKTAATVATAPVAPSPSTPVAPAPSAPAVPAAPEAIAPESAPTAPAPANPPAQSVPVPTQPAPAASPKPARPASPRAAPASPSAPSASGPTRARTDEAPAPRSPVRVTSGGARVEPAVERGWQALQAGDLAQAREEYARALTANPTDRDALLGLAAIDVRNQDFGSAEARYARLLELDPRDAYAQAAIVSLRGQSDAVQTESRLKNLAAQQPDAPILSFALGNQYASQRRWAEAQQAYFKAFAADPDNPDYAYNLAVSLDQLRQPKLALEYYQRAVALASGRTVGFNPVQVESRVRELQR